jgi:hypothetical protein
MHVNADTLPSRRRPRRSVGAVLAAMLALGGLLVGPVPQPARAALIATGINDSHAMRHDRVAVVPAPGVLGNDLNLFGSASAILVSDVSHGTLALQSNGGYTYTPAPAYVGSDSFRYRPSGLLSTDATVTITITNATPVAQPDAYSGAAGTTLLVAAPGVLGNDSDADGDALVTEMVGGVASGSLTLNTNGGLQYTPAAGFSGSATFSYRVRDGVVWSGPTTVTLTIAAPVPTPAPVPPPTPAPTATPRPTSPPTVPLATPSAPQPQPSLPPPLQPSRAASAPASPQTPVGETRSPASAATPEPSGNVPTASDSPVTASSAGSGGGGLAPPSSGGSTAPGGGNLEAGLPSIRFEERRLDLVGTSVGLFAGIEIWAVPAATIALPGILVLVWVALQTAGAIAWMPAVRRLRGDDRRARRPRYRTPPA